MSVYYTVIKSLTAGINCMIYQKKSSIGQAGENYFAYWVSRYFEWPCRLLSIDVGIDVQVEFFDDSKRSVGCFIGVQIKTTSGNNPNVSVGLDNLKYWQSIDDIVLLVSICMDDEKPRMYWKHINDNHIDKYISDSKKNGSKQTTIKFNAVDELLLKHKYKWINLLLGHNRVIYIIQAKYLLSDVRKLKSLINNVSSYTDKDIKEFVHNLNAMCGNANFTGWPFDNKKLLSRQLYSVSLALSKYNESIGLFESELEKIIMLCNNMGKDIKSYINSDMTNYEFLKVINKINDKAL